MDISPKSSPVRQFRTETGSLLHLAWPLLAAQLAQMGMGVVDTIMAGRVGADDLAGVSLGGSVMWPVMMLITGVLQAVTPSVSQLRGANKYNEIGEVIRQALYMAAVGAVLIVLVLVNIAPFYTLLEVDPDAVKISVAGLPVTQTNSQP